MRRLAMLVLVLGGLVVSCVASDEEQARKHAAKACADFGYGVDSGSTTPSTAEELGNAASGSQSVADEAALAARLDSRWDRLSNALTDAQEFLELAAIFENESLPQAERDAARANADQLDAPNMLRTFEQECRKATV